MLLLAVLFSMFVCQGCRTLRSTRHTKELAAARQRSLRGADELQQENWNEAELLFTEALRRSPADERAQWGMAEVLWQRGEGTAAIKHMEQATQISGDSPDLLVRLGEMHFKEGGLDAALDNADRALQGDRQHANAWALRGKVQRKRQQLDDALHSYHRALICQPNSPEVQVELAEIYWSLKRPQRALATLDRMADAQPEEEQSARSWMLRGLALADLGERQDAQNCLKLAALCAEESETPLLVQLAQTQFEAGELAEARICLGRALRNDPNNPQALAIQAEVDRRFNDFSRETGPLTLPAGFRILRPAQN